jgi:hypothetical protein
MQLLAGSLSSQTVHAEQAPRSQPIFVPVRPRSLRRTSTSVVAGSSRTEMFRPFTDRLTGTAPGPKRVVGLDRAGALQRCLREPRLQQRRAGRRSAGSLDEVPAKHAPVRRLSPAGRKILLRHTLLL